MNFLKIFVRNLVHGPSTEPFPFGPAVTPTRLRGRIAFKMETCTGCRACEQVCAPGAIRFDKTPEGLRFTMWHNTCVFCGLCEFYCPTDAIRQTDDWQMAHSAEDQFAQAIQETIPYVTCAACGAKALSSAPNPAVTTPPLTPEEVQQQRNLCPGCRKKALAERGAAS